MIGGFQVGPFQPAYQQFGTLFGAQIQGAGGSGRHRRFTRYVLRIDGKEYACSSLAEALRLLEDVKAKALKVAQKATRAATGPESTSVVLEAPRIEANSRDLRAAVSETHREIDKIYRQAVIDAEIAMIFALDQRNIDDDDAMMLLM
jgi:hypothetical protein